MTEEQMRGRRILVILIVLTAAADLVVMLVKLYVGRFEASSIARLGLTLGLFYFLWIGARWAKAVTILLYGTAGIGGIVFSLRISNASALLLFGMGILWVTFAILLGVSADLDAFLRHQREAQRQTREELESSHEL